jgi:hypothetical protein
MDYRDLKREVYTSPVCEVVTVELNGTITMVSGYRGFNDEEEEWQ